MGAVERKDNAAVLEDLGKQAAAKSDSFKIKVFWQPTEREARQVWLTMEGATLNHLVNTEEWLPLLAGNLSGLFTISVYHTSDVNKPLPGELHWNGMGNSRTYEPPDTSVIGTAQWNGPSKQIFPAPMPRIGAGSALPPPVRNALSFVDGQGRPSAQPAQNQATPGMSPAVQALELKIQGLMDAQNRERESAREDRFRREMQEKDREWKAELERVRQSSALAAIPKAQEKNFLDQLPALMTALAPFVAGFVSMRQSDAASAAQREQDRLIREDREREERRKTDAELRAKELAFQTQIFAQMNADKDKSNAAYKDMAEVTTKISRVAIENAHAMMDMQQSGPAPSQTAEIIQAISGPLTKVAQIYLASKTAPNAHLSGPPVMPAVLRPQAIPAPIPVPEVTVTGPVRTRAEVDAADCTIPAEGDPFSVVMEMIKNKEPAYFPAKVIVENLMHPKMLSDLKRHGMQIEGLIEEKLGEFRRTSPENEAYTRDLLVDVSVRGIRKGLFQRAQALELLVGLGISDANEILPQDAPKAKPVPKSAPIPVPDPVSEDTDADTEGEDDQDGDDQDEDADPDDEDSDTESEDDDQEEERSDDDDAEQEELSDETA